MRAMRGGAKSCADDNQQRGRNERRFASNSVTQESNDDLAKDRA